MIRTYRQPARPKSRGRIPPGAGAGREITGDNGFGDNSTIKVMIAARTDSGGRWPAHRALVGFDWASLRHREGSWSGRIRSSGWKMVEATETGRGKRVWSEPRCLVYMWDDMDRIADRDCGGYGRNLPWQFEEHLARGAKFTHSD